AVDRDEGAQLARTQTWADLVARRPVVCGVGRRRGVPRLPRGDLVPAEVVADDLHADPVQAVEPLRERPRAVGDPRVVLEPEADPGRGGADTRRGEHAGRDHDCKQDDSRPHDQTSKILDWSSDEPSYPPFEACKARIKPRRPAGAPGTAEHGAARRASSGSSAGTAPGPPRPSPPAPPTRAGHAGLRRPRRLRPGR